MKSHLRSAIPLFIALGVTILFNVVLIGWWGFWVIFPWIGGWVTVGNIMAKFKKGKKKDFGRRLSILMISPVFLVFLGLLQRENLQLEQCVFYIAAGLFTRVLIHYAIAKILGPLIWGRGFCGWACWTAAFLEWLPIKENNPVPKKYTYIRYPVLLISILIPALFIQMGYDYYNLHIAGDTGAALQLHKFHQLIWFLTGNGIYYLTAIPFAFAFKKKRAFCKIACPVSLVMKLQTRIALIKRKPTGEKCTECGSCNKNCPMDIDVMSYLKNRKKVTSTECILCDMCVNVCPEKAIK
ncbi:MAG: 4Fe-4S dicluster domain-containing protein [Bacteroidia bacterium]|nr:4Fe-4S dicluster domain-containing protein [Bacteroidia bacterium]